MLKTSMSGNNSHATLFYYLHNCLMYLRKTVEDTASFFFTLSVTDVFIPQNQGSYLPCVHTTTLTLTSLRPHLFLPQQSEAEIAKLAQCTVI